MYTERYSLYDTSLKTFNKTTSLKRKSFVNFEVPYIKPFTNE